MIKRTYSNSVSLLRGILPPNLLFAFLLILLFLINAFHESYPDEFDNISGGWFILHGRLLYTGFFTHHGPVPYFIAALVELFSGQSFINFRVVYSLFIFFILVFPYLFIRKSLERKISFYPFLIGYIGLAATYYWTHMLLADNIAAFCFMPVFALLTFKVFYKKILSNSDVVFISILSAIGLYSSLTYLYLYVITLTFTLFSYYKNRSLPFKKFSFHNPFVYFLIPHVFFLVYLILTGSLYDYLYQNLVFNSRYYIYNYPRPSGSTFINPIRFAIVILNNFINSYYILILGIKNFAFDFPMNNTMAAANTAASIYYLFRRRWSLATFLFLTLVYSNARSNPLDSAERDYQSAVYILISFFNIFFILTELYKSLNLTQKFGKKIIYGALFFIAGVYFLISINFLTRKFADKFYPKYMGSAPLIYDRPKIAPIVNRILNKNDYVWIGPFEFEEWFYTNAIPASKYHILIPGMGMSDKIKVDFIREFNKTMPKVIFFDKNFFILNYKAESYSGFFLDFLKKDYVILLDYQDNNTKYRSVAPIHIGEKVDLDAKMYIRRDVASQVIKKLVEAGYVVAYKVK